MPTNPGYEYIAALKKYHEAKNSEEKLKALELMYQTAPKHKSSEKLVADIRKKIAKLKSFMEAQAKSKKGSHSLSVKKEGAATVVIVGTTNSGKSTLLKKLTNANVEIADYPFTTKKPEVGIMDYKGIKIQIIEIPAIVKNFADTVNGPSLLSIIRNSSLIILMFNSPEEKLMLDSELQDIQTPILIYNSQVNIGYDIWKRLGIIKVYTKQPGKPKDSPPIAMKENSAVKDLARIIHKDFINKFRFARIFGQSAKFPGAQVGLSHILKDDDIVEIYLK